MYKIKNVSKQYGTEYALKNISLSVGKGMNFIVGSSGSGKTTLLKIMYGIEQDYEGEVYYHNQNLKQLSAYEMGYLCNSKIGFIWQDFHLLEDLTVMENILIPTYLKEQCDIEKAKKILRTLHISNITYQKVKSLSGGQKQRVTIARELMKDPEVILVDEATSALDVNAAKNFMKILRELAKTKIVIVVTHDTSLIEIDDHIYELDKGELLKHEEVSEEIPPKHDVVSSYSFSLKNAISLAMLNTRKHFFRFLVSIFTIVIATALLLTSFGGSISSSGKETFDKLISTYGDTLLDIQLSESFMNASGVDNSDEENSNGSVSQDISGLYEKYKQDKRVQFVLFSKAYDNITIVIDETSHRIDSSGSVPVLNKMISGRMPKEDKNEVVIPKNILSKLGYDKDSILGKEIDFSSNIYSWKGEEPTAKDVKAKATIVGVSNNDATYEYEGKTVKYSVDDSFFFSKKVQEDIQKQAGLSENKTAFVIRAKTARDLISIKNELNKKGIIPLGQFELVEDMVKMEKQTNKQAGSANIVIVFLSFLMIIAIFMLTYTMRKKEYAIYKINGFANKHLQILSYVETTIQVMGTFLLLFIISPLINVVTERFFLVRVVSFDTIYINALLTLLLSIITLTLNLLTIKSVSILKELTSGDRV